MFPYDRKRSSNLLRSLIRDHMETRLYLWLETSTRLSGKRAWPTQYRFLSKSRTKERKKIQEETVAIHKLKTGCIKEALPINVIHSSCLEPSDDKIIQIKS